jgi:hypothetical protein
MQSTNTTYNKRNIERCSKAEHTAGQMKRRHGRDRGTHAAVVLEDRRREAQRVPHAARRCNGGTTDEYKMKTQKMDT